MKKKLNAKLFFLTMVPIVLFMILSVAYILPGVRQDIYDAKREQVKAHSEIGVSIVEHYYQLAQNGEINEDEAKTNAMEAIRSVRYGEQSEDYFWINDYDHQMLMHPFTTELEGEDVSDVQDPDGVFLFQEMVQTVKESKEGFVEYQWQYYDEEQRIEPKITYVIGFEPWNWVIGTGIYMEDIAPLVMQRILTLFGFIVGVVVLSIIMTSWLSKKMIIRPLREVVRVADDYGNGVFKEQVKIESEDEIGLLASAFNGMRDNLVQLLQEVKNTAEGVGASSQQLSASMQENASVSNEIASAVGDIASGAQNQAERTESALENAQTLGDRIVEDQRSVNELDHLTEEVSDQKEKGIATVERLFQASEENRKGTSVVTGIVKQTKESAEAIKDASAAIKDIAEQTNLLALNASIEAARAGESGKGFAVVAEEIRKLAENSDEHSVKIAGIIEKLNQKADEGVQTMNYLQNELMRKQNDEISNTSKQFEEIARGIQSIQGKVSELRESSTDMQNKKETIIESLNDLAAIAEENSSSTEEIAASVEEQTASLSEVTNSSDELASLAEKLLSEVNKFDY
ncbi:MAG TPA: methyl-accepting chemotaxis protein [Eubacteriaceae bacterium]|nr:methyl-accepting chemotaxis protein [Eubacteriaceae bacterium]